MRSLSEVKKDNLEATCRTVARKTGKAHSVVRRGNLGVIVETDTIRDTDVVTYEHTGRV